MLAAMGIAARECERYGADLRRELPSHGIDTSRRIAHFIVQVTHESSMFTRVVENMNYSAEGLRAVFPRYFDRSGAQAYARNSRAIGNRAYANRPGNGDEASGGGFRLRARGLIQLTGCDNYRAFGEWLGVESSPSPHSSVRITPSPVRFISGPLAGSTVLTTDCVCSKKCKPCSARRKFRRPRLRRRIGSGRRC
jgi:predicted chitinase